MATNSEAGYLIKEYFTAVEDCNITKIEELLNSGAISVDLTNVNNYDRTALHIAACNDSYDLVKLLVDKYKAKVNIKDKRGQIPLQVATDYRNMDIVKFLLERGSNLREYAANYLNSDEVEELFRAAEENNIERIVQLLTERGLNVDIEDRSKWHHTILEVAATNGYYELVRLLVEEYGANIDHEDDLEETAVIMALNNKHENVANFLLEKGASKELLEI